MNTESVTAPVGRLAVSAPPPRVPAAFAEAWRAASPATPLPVVAGPAVVTGAGSTTAGRDPATGDQVWSYTRDLPLCTVAEGFGRALALYRNGDYCSELTTLDPGTGARGPQRILDVRPGARLISGGTLVAATDTHYLEVLRSDLVKTTEYGQVRAPEQPGRQPRAGCSYGSFAFSPERLGVLERCPTDTTDRLTVLRPAGAGDATRPEVELSTAVPTSGAQLVAVSADRLAVALPNPPRLQILDGAGRQVALTGLDVPATDLGRDPAGGATPIASDQHHLYWWSGSSTVALGRADLTPAWTLHDTLGPGTSYAGSLLVPVSSGLLVVDPDRGVAVRTIAVDRGGWTGPVALATQGSVLLEQRGPNLVALRAL